jgi:hypothetical protein
MPVMSHEVTVSHRASLTEVKQPHYREGERGWETKR